MKKRTLSADPSFFSFMSFFALFVKIEKLLSYLYTQHHSSIHIYNEIVDILQPVIIFEFDKKAECNLIWLNLIINPKCQLISSKTIFKQHKVLHFNTESNKVSNALNTRD